MGRFKDCVRKYLAVLVDITGLEKEKPEQDIEMDTKVETKANTKVDAKVDCSTTHPTPDHKPTPTSKKGWKHRPDADFPWRLEQVVEEEENWRGTWVLEVKDMGAMDWATLTRVSKADGNGRGGRDQRQPTRHLPFPVGGDGYRESLTGGQDDLMVQLGKP